jgi:hypothetical protein
MGTSSKLTYSEPLYLHPAFSATEPGADVVTSLMSDSVGDAAVEVEDSGDSVGPSLVIPGAEEMLSPEVDVSWDSEEL